MSFTSSQVRNGNSLLDFLSTPDDVREGIYNTLSLKLEKTPEILEKDIWVCWVLDVLFTMPDRDQMAFKGGTSLSKAYDAIFRFSEDLDITIAHQYLDPTMMPFDGSQNHKQMSKTLNQALSVYVKGTVEPHFREKLSKQFPEDGWALDVVANGGELRLTYPTVTNTDPEINPSQSRDYVKMEFGGRNATDPVEELEVAPYILGLISGLALPTAKTRVLAGARTFWEKVTLAHYECHRTETKPNAERLSRHWYDLSRLADHRIGAQALSDIPLLQDVVKYKTLFFNSTYAHYDECLRGELRLLPDAPVLSALETDYKAMLAKSMIYGEIPSFEQIVNRLKQLETEINERVLAFQD
jgi:hypothetical protein